ncbi:MAG: TM0106 family RecB-like putative nuclease [Bacteroidota bacterium]
MNFTNNIFYLSATDLSNHLSCRHLTELNRKVALKELERPYYNDPQLEILIERGHAHEKAYVEFLKRQGKNVVDGRSVGLTEAMRQGADVIVQAPLDLNQWNGLADILIKVPGKSKFGDWQYEVQDTKLAQNTKAGTILQLCLYTDLLSELQGVSPEKFHVIKPVENFEPESYRFDDFKAYYRLTKSSFAKATEDKTEPRTETYPEPVDHCGVCRWWKVCDTRRHDDDYLSLVAGIRSSQIEELKTQGVRKLEDFAKLEKIAEPKRGNVESYVRRQAQAKIQYEGRLQEQLIHNNLPVEPGRGLNRLPEPNPGDIYFDIEGDEYYPNGGLEYILGYCYQEDNQLVYQNRWSKNRLEEKHAFSDFMKFVMEQWKRHPNMYIYHFAPYEPTAIKRLARVHAVYEREVDDLLRAERFIDLHAVFKEALLASVESYSLKSLELFTKYTRKVELVDASRARKKVEVALELNDTTLLTKEIVTTTEDYNEDDCRATQALHEWLEGVRSKAIADGKEITRPVIGEPEPNPELAAQEKRSEQLYLSLTSRLPEERQNWTDEDRARWLLAHQLDYFRRENKSAWWEHFRLQKLEEDNIADERKAIAGLEFIGEVQSLKKRSTLPIHRYKFPPQELGVSVGDSLIIVNSVTPEEKYGRTFGTVEAISHEERTIDIKKTKKTIETHARSVHMLEPIDTGVLWTSLMNIAAEVDENGLDHKWQYRASKDLLMRRDPKLIDGGKMEPLGLDRSILPIQGPPGTGKSTAGARMIIELVKAKKKVGVTAVSYSVITTLLSKVKELADKNNENIGFALKVTNTMESLDDWIAQLKDKEKIIEAIGEGKVVGGTAWLWANDDLVDKLDYLFIDEAGQMSLSQALAASRAAKNIVLLGDPQQLEQPQRGAHPEGSDVAALSHLLEGHKTMPANRGLFLGTTYRLHPSVCEFTSEIFYENKLKSAPDCSKQLISGGTDFDGAGLFYVPVDHRGNQNNSPEEVEKIYDIIQDLLKRGQWTGREGKTQALTNKDILVVAPYNAQVAALIRKMPDVPVGTVDKFQGKEAPVVIYSMTSSSHEDAPRGMTFLFSPNRLNVATSRAKCISILVASPRLLEPECKTIDQMKWANGLCRYVEMVR